MFRFRKHLTILAIVAVGLGVVRADNGPGPNNAESSAPHPWSSAFSAPTEIVTPRVYLEPLTPDHTAMDFAAVKSSNDHLRKTLQWGGWPPADMTLDDNRFALERHWAEFENQEAYAYTVLSPDKESCLGCIYLNPFSQSKTRLSVIFWVRADQLTTDLDIHLVETIISEVKDSWPVDVIELPIPGQNQRGQEILTQMPLQVLETSERQTVFGWQRTSAN